jgi:hypothetical protein
MIDRQARIVALLAILVNVANLTMQHQAASLQRAATSFHTYALDRDALLHVDSTGFDDGWRGARDDHGFPIASAAAKAKVAEQCPSANPLYVEKYGNCPTV